MKINLETSRRNFLKLAAAAGAGLKAGSVFGLTPPLSDSSNASALLEEFGYGDVRLTNCLQQTQFEQTQSVLMNLNEDSLLRPFRMRAGLPAPGEDLGGWYDEFPGYDYMHGNDRGFAPGATFGQWISALARGYAAEGSPATRDKINRLLQGYSQTINESFYTHFRFPAYTYDKLVLGLMDARQFSGQQDALAMLDRTTQAALPHLPSKAAERDKEPCSVPRPDGTRDRSFCWDESYTMPENLFLAYQRGAGDRYRELAVRYLQDDSYFDPLADNKNVLPGRHAYSYMNALSSAMQAYLTLGSEKHLRAASNAFEMIHQTQSYATGGWGPDEMFVAPGSGKLAASLTSTHNSFETPCGAYAHFKLTRYLLRVTREARYGDSMERVMYNTVLGAKPLQLRGDSFYYSDYNFDGKKVYHRSLWPCCSGTLPQVATDYRISTYFKDVRGVLVNLYIPSTLKWRQGGAEVALIQSGSYPTADNVSFHIEASQPTTFSIQFRIPAWAKGANIKVNGKREPLEVVPGTFATLRKTWKTGDSVDLELPMSLRLEAVDDQNPNIVALCVGPLVLFAIAPGKQIVTRQQLLAAAPSPDRTGEWRVTTSNRSGIRMLPFTQIQDEAYSTYLKVT